MSYVFGKRSKESLSTCNSALQTLAKKALATSPMDFSIICGHRNKQDQDKAFSDGTSKLRWPRSKHNKQPSLAFDAVPYPLDWNDLDSFKDLGEHIKSTWESLSLEEKEGWDLSWGGDWKSFKDYPHYELIKLK